MKRKQITLLGVSIICLIVFLGGLYFALSGYRSGYSAYHYKNGTTMTNYSYLQKKDSIALKFGSFDGMERYSLKLGDSKMLNITGEIKEGTLSLSINDSQNNKIELLNESDIPYELDLSHVDKNKINLVIEGEFSGNLNFNLK